MMSPGRKTHGYMDCSDAERNHVYTAYEFLSTLIYTVQYVIM